VEFNNVPLAAAIKKEMGDDTVVKTKCGMPGTVSTEVDGKKSKLECLPLYFFCPGCVSPLCCKSALEKTAKNAAAAAGGAPAIAEMER
jgi:hypothetical protein